MARRFDAPLGLSPVPGPMADPSYLESMHAAWQHDPQSVPESWRYFFQGLTFGGCVVPVADCRPAAEEAARAVQAQAAVSRLILAYRRQGYLAAQVDPLADAPTVPLPVLELAAWGLSDADLERSFDAGLLRTGERELLLREMLEVLRRTYCGPIGVEFMHIQDRPVREWLETEMEQTRNHPRLPPEERLPILEALTDAELFEKFTHSRYPGQKRFSLEGAETLIPGLHAVIEASPSLGVEEIVIGMPHRGRLNVLANVVGMSYEAIFSEFEGNFLPDSVHGDGDVKYHRGYSSDWTTRSGDRVHLSLTSNPSHLEAVDPVVQGRARAKQRRREDTELRMRVLPLLLHGDAAFAGQGIVAETFNLSQLPGYRTGGTLHVVVNNQIGFTTTPQEGRSTVNCTDVAKMVEAPIFHVNGDDPEAVVYAMGLALRFRQHFHRDVVVDLVCYRRHGHNEADDPAFTQPLLYETIKDRPSARALFLRRLIDDGEVLPERADELAGEFRARLERAHETAKRANVQIQVQPFEGAWRGLDRPFSHDPVATGVERPVIDEVAHALCTVPDGFRLNPKVARVLGRRLHAVAEGGAVDWSFAELLAFGTLLHEGTPVRLSGQDSARGTFSQRHAVWQDMQTQQPYVPLSHLREGQPQFCVYNSALSEAAVLGFEYGYALAEPGMLILWEAQFGDFVNGAQVIVDQFLAGATSKWQRACGLVLLLPHGYEGQGPEHSNAYIERFLQACAEDNLQVCAPSTPAQYFHLLRRQVRRAYRLPLVVLTPKSMLRHKRVVSPITSLCEGSFEEVLEDCDPPRGHLRRLVLCSGKIYWELVERREVEGVQDVALVRIEQLYPLHLEKLRAVVEPYRQAVEVIWAQEEAKNRGAWSAVFPRLIELFPEHPIGYVGRDASASPATGSSKQHMREQNAILRETLHGSIAKEGDEGRGQNTVCGRVGQRGSIDRVA